MEITHSAQFDNKATEKQFGIYSENQTAETNSDLTVSII